nr:reverse transcriptase domain-containing protein [Tanacetum cinerariifolium]
MNEANMKTMQTQIKNVKNELRNKMENSIQAPMSNQTNELKNMMASFFQMNNASTLGSGPLPSNTIANPKGELKAITTRSGIVLDGPSVLMPPPFINPKEDERVEETLTNKDLAEYTIKSTPHLRKTFLTDCSSFIDVHREEMILRDGDERLTLNIRHDTSSYSNQPQKESINMNNIFDDSSEDFLEDLFETNHQSGNPTFSFHFDLTLSEVKDDIFDQEGDMVLIEKLINLNSTKDIRPPHNVNPLSGCTTSSSPNHLLKEFAGELALITFPPGNDDLPFDIKSDLKEIEYLLNHDPIKDMDSILKDSIDESNLENLNDNLVDTMLEMFTDEHALDYSTPPLYDEYDDIFELESDIEYVYDDPFDSKEDEIKEFKLLIDELDLLRSSNFLSSLEYDSFLFEDFSEVDALPSTNNKDKIFNPGILIQENLFEVITHVAPDKNVKKLAISHASLILEDFDPPLSLYELFFPQISSLV